MTATVASTAPDRRIESRAIARSGPISHRSCGGEDRCARTRPINVGTYTSDSTKSTITPIEAPMPNSRTAAMSDVASDSIPSAVVTLAPSSGANRCATLEVKARW